MNPIVPNSPPRPRWLSWLAKIPTRVPTVGYLPAASRAPWPHGTYGQGPMDPMGPMGTTTWDLGPGPWAMPMGPWGHVHGPLGVMGS